MSNYRRLISYIYAYEGGIKGKNIGFAKIETRGVQCKITVSVKKVYVGGNDIGVYLLAGDQEISLGNIFIRGGSGEFRALVSVSDVEHSGIPMDQCYGLTIHDVTNTWRSYTTIWEDAVAHAAELDLAGTTSEAKEEDGPLISQAQIERAVKEIAEEFPLEQTPLKAPEAETQARPQGEAEPEASLESKSEPNSELEPEPSLKTESESESEPEAEPKPETEAEPEPKSEAEPELRMEGKGEPESSEKAQAFHQETGQREASSDNPRPALEETTGSTICYRADAIKQEFEKQNQEPVEPGDPRELERLSRQEEQEEDAHEQVWERLKREHTRILAFDYERGCEILTIKPQDIGLLPREAWVYGNNSFLLHGYYNYRYLILARLNNPAGTPRYLLGVPGHYYSNERYMASMFGFPNFVLSKEQPMGDGRFGYWYTDVKLGSGG